MNSNSPSHRQMDDKMMLDSMNTSPEPLRTSSGPGGDEERIAAPTTCHLSPNDVLCGRGKLAFHHVGNRKFREAIYEAVEPYNNATTRFDKTLIVHSIMDAISKEGGKFLKWSASASQWCQLSDSQARVKVGHAIRDAIRDAASKDNDNARKRKDPPKAQKDDDTAGVRQTLEQAMSEHARRATIPAPPLPAKTAEIEEKEFLEAIESTLGSLSDTADEIDPLHAWDSP